jgi:hypothetical protein
MRIAMVPIQRQWFNRRDAHRKREASFVVDAGAAELRSHVPGLRRQKPARHAPPNSAAGPVTKDDRRWGRA